MIDGCSKIRNYLVEKREAGRRSWQTVLTKCDRLYCRVMNLEEGTMYQFRVSAVNEFGVGEARECEEPVLAAEVPTTPVNVELVKVTDTSVSLSWGVPEQSGGSRVKGYIIEAQQKGTESREYIVMCKTKSTRGVAVGLSTGADYYFRVKAFNDCGCSDPRDLVSSVTIKEPRAEPSIDISSCPMKIFQVYQGKPIEIELPIFGLLLHQTQSKSSQK